MSDTPSRANRDTGAGNHGDRPGFDREEMRHQAEETGEELREAARLQAEGLLDRQKAAAADQAERVTNVLHKMADEFERQEQPYFSGCVQELAKRSDAFSRTLRERELSDLMHQARKYGREHPTLFVGGAIAAGFMLSRFLRSSSQEEPQRH